MIGLSIYRINTGVVIAYVDFSKAFDVVSHNKLFVRLSEMFSGNQ